MDAYYESLFYERERADLYIHYNDRKVGCMAHLHHDVELVLVLSGKVQASIDRKEYVLGAGDAVIAFPNQVHMYTDLPESENILMIFPPEYCRELEKIFTRKIPVASAVYELPGELIDFARKAEKASSLEQTPFHRAQVRGYATLFLSGLLDKMTMQGSDSYDYHTLNTLKGILSFCDDHYLEEDLSLQTISSGLNISKYYVSHLFNERLQISFSDYVSLLRIRRASQLLRSGNESISQVALSCGFNSIRSFNRHFAQLTGQTPSEYRRAVNRDREE